jgi:hypothetical protein
MNNPKIRRSAAAVVLLFSVLFSAGANEVSAVWIRLYGQADTLDYKLQIMKSIIEQHDRDMIPVLSDALDEQVRNLKNLTSTTEKAKATELTKMVVKELGRLKAVEAASYVWEVVEAVDDPFLKGESLIAIGKMGAKQYAGPMAMMLRNINFNYGSLMEQRENEIIAYALIIALERLKDEAAYEPLFFAASGWYSSKSGVKERASEALAVLVQDPTPQLTAIMEQSDRYAVKEAALQAGLRSGADDQSKASLASFALAEGLRYTPKDGIEKRELKSLRLYALSAMKRLQNKNLDVLESMESMILGYQTGRLFEEDEMLMLIETMGTFDDDESARILSSFLMYQTERREGRASDSLRIAKATVQALGDIGSPVGFEALTMVTIASFWEGSVQREAKAALEKLNN